METPKNPEVGRVNDALRLAVLRWQLAPESERVANEINSSFVDAMSLKLDLVMKVKSSVVRGGFLTIYIPARKTPERGVTVKAIKGGLLFTTEKYPIRFRPDEVATLRVK